MATARIVRLTMNLYRAGVIWIIIVTVSLVILAGWKSFESTIAPKFASIFATASLEPLKQEDCPTSYQELITLSENELSRIDIARMNLLCSEELIGAENMDVDKCLSTLDQWAEIVKQAERKYSGTYYQNPGKYDNSYAKFQAVNLALTLKEDLGCGYNMKLVESGVMTDIRSTCFYKNSQDLFLHGYMMKKTGSCTSLPVLMVAVGRRCGYPLHLAACKGHLFCRWDDKNARFNLETACPGVDSKPDSYYRTWPHPITGAEEREEKYLKTLTASEELGVFAHLRAACLQENHRFVEAAEAYQVALRAFPDSTLLKAYLSKLKEGD